MGKNSFLLDISKFQYALIIIVKKSNTVFLT